MSTRIVENLQPAGDIPSFMLKGGSMRVVHRQNLDPKNQDNKFKRVLIQLEAYVPDGLSESDLVSFLEEIEDTNSQQSNKLIVHKLEVGEV